jgi:hypothetical protein
MATSGGHEPHPTEERLVTPLQGVINDAQAESHPTEQPRTGQRR